MLGLLKFKRKIYVGGNSSLREQILKQIHESNLGGHFGVQGTYQRVKLVFLWPGLKSQVQQLVSTCPICQLSKSEHVKSPGLLQPVRVPEQTWMHITMDFIEQLPKSKGKEMIWVVVYRLTKYSHFIALSHPLSASSLAQVFIEEIYRLHGLPSYIVCDRGSIFTSSFGRELIQQL